MTTTRQIPLLFVALMLLPASRLLASDTETVRQASKTGGGLIVCIGCDDPQLLTDLRASDRCLVQGIDTDAKRVQKAKKHITEKGMVGPVTAAQFDGEHLPFIDNLVDAVVIRDARCSISRDEIARVLAPRGVVLAPKGFALPFPAFSQPSSDGDLVIFKKTVPSAMDDWTHYLHGANNNAVSRDELVDQPFRIQWTDAPRWARHHDYLASTSALVAAEGRIFSIEDRGPISSLDRPSQWVLVARNAFNGLTLWKRKIGSWENRFRPFRSGPPQLGRRLVAVGNRVYATLGYGQPVAILDAATGETMGTCAGTEEAQELVCLRGVLYVSAGNGWSEQGAKAARRGIRDTAAEGNMRIMATDAETGKTVWQRSDPETACMLPTTLCADHGRLFFQNSSRLVCLDAKTGKTIWHANRPSRLVRKSWSAPTLVVYDGVVLSADKAALRRASEIPKAVTWKITSRPDKGSEGKGELIAYSASDGKELWRCKTAISYTAPPDIMVAAGLVWTGMDVGRNRPDFRQGRDPHTGHVRRKLNTDQAFASAHHHRCYRDRATDRCIILGRTGIEFIPLDPLDGSQQVRHCWVRGECQYGVMPANGLLYLPPHSCACYIQSKLDGFWALAPKRITAYREQAGDRRVKGIAYGTVTASGTEKRPGQWPTYRHDQARSSRTPVVMKPGRTPSWTADIGGKLTGLVAACETVLVASTKTHTVHALDATTGEHKWRYTARGRIDSPPTICGDAAIFGCADGSVYCLRLSDGALVWRFLAARLDLQTVCEGQLESVWPVTGSVLLHDGRIYCTSGRSSFLDGGMTMYQLDPATGKCLARKVFDTRDPKTGGELEETVTDTELPGALPDILVCDGKWIYLRDQRMDVDGNVQKPDVPHLYSSVGLLNGQWWYRTYWQWGSRTWGRYSGWHVVDDFRPSGRIMATDDQTVFGYGRKTVDPKDHNMSDSHLFRAAKKVIPTGENNRKIANNNNRALREGQQASNVRYLWKRDESMMVRAMVLSKDVLFVAGPTSQAMEEALLDDASHPAALVAVDTETGNELARCPLSSQPVFDGMMACGGDLFVALVDGTVRCITAK